MRSLPLGVPKVLVSTMAAGHTGAYVGTRDLCLMHSVTDIAGLNRVSRKILRNAAYAVAGMARSQEKSVDHEDRPLVAITMFGITTPGVLRLRERLETSGFEAIVFHAVGSGGRAMEAMIDEGLIDGVIDYTVSEITDEHLGGVFGAGPNRLEAAGRQGIPQVVIPGAIEVINFAGLEALPKNLNVPERRLIVHNENVCAVRALPCELVELGAILARKINQAKGPTAVLLPLRGLDKYQQRPDGPWVDSEADTAFFGAFRDGLRSGLDPIELELNINDPAFADTTFETFLELWTEARS